MQVHECPSISDRSLFGIYEGFGKFDPVVDVIATAAPVEFSSIVFISSAFVRVAVARPQLPLAAGSSERVDDSCWGDGIDECCFTAAWE